jgi:hypothetical protein
MIQELRRIVMKENIFIIVLQEINQRYYHDDWWGPLMQKNIMH